MNSFYFKIFERLKQYRTLFFICLLTMVVGCYFVASKIQFSEDISKVLPTDEHNEVTAKVMNQLNFSDKIVVMMHAKKKQVIPQLSRMADSFLVKLQKDTSYFTKIQGQIHPAEMQSTFDFVYNHLPLFLDENDYSLLAGRISADSINARIQKDYSTLISPAGIVARNFVLKDPLNITSLGLQKLKTIGLAKDFIIYNGYITSKDSATILLFINPKFSGTDTKHNERFVKQLYAYRDTINTQFKHIGRLTYFGAPFVAVANAQQIKSDIQHTVVYSLLVLIALLIFFYRRFYIPFILFIPAACAVSIALVVLYLLPHEVSAISLGIGAILLGITVDYPLHIITHFRENNDVKQLYENVTVPIMASSLTTALSFLCLVFVRSEVLIDLGIFASISVFLSAVFSLLIIPHIYLPQAQARKTIIDRFAAHAFEKDKILIGITVIVAIIGMFTFSKIKFNSDISDLNYFPANMKASEQQLSELGDINSKSIYVTTFGDSLQTVIQNNHRLEKKLHQLKEKGLIEGYSSIGKFVLSKEVQNKKIARWNKFWRSAGKDTVVQLIQKKAQSLGFNANAFQQFSSFLSRPVPTIDIDVYKNFTPLTFSEYYAQKNGFITLSSIIKTDSVHRNVVMKNLKGPHILLIDRKQLSETFLGQMKNDFKTLINFSFIAVFLVLLYFFKRIEIAALSIIPITLTGFATAGIVYLLGLEFNIFSTVITTLIFGLGVDFSIFITSGLQKEFTTGKNEIPTYRASICLAVLTTVLAIGVLIFAEHPALRSISSISIIGLIAALLITFSLYPMLFRFFATSRAAKGKTPVSFRLYFLSITSFFYYFLGNFTFILLGSVYLYLFPIKKEKKRFYFRKYLQLFMRTVMHSNYKVHGKLHNPLNEKFEKPAIIIANHTSFLDTIAMGFIPTPLVYTVKDRIYHHPIYGKTVQLAQYYPFSKGEGINEDALLEELRNGYSVVIFPEGTRSQTNDIGRFHKGAFLLAQKHNVDILPVYMHGNADLAPKNDFIIFDGNYTIEIGKRIASNEISTRENLHDLTKKISQQFKVHFLQMRHQLEGPDYFKQKILLSYRYKSFHVSKAAKKEFEELKTAYHQLNPLLSSKATIMRVGNDLGIADLLLVLQQAKRKVFTFISDKENRAIASHNHWLKKRRITYLSSISSVEATNLLISTAVPEEQLKEIITLHTWENIFILTPTAAINNSLFESYTLHLKNEYFYHFKIN